MKKNIDQALQDMLQKVKPKARYISQLHVDEYNDSIYKQIVNGDIQIPKQRKSIDKKQEKQGFQEIYKKKLMEKIQKEKQELQHKLGYISNSINSMKKYDELKALVRNPRSMRDSLNVNRSQSQQWREHIKQRSKQLQQKKKKIQQQKKKREEQMNQIVVRLKQQKNEKKKKQIMQKMKIIQQRMKKRDQLVKTGNQRYIQVKKQKSLFQKINQSYQEKQQSFLQQQKKKLAEIRSLKRPIDQNQIKQHQTKFMQLKRQKQQLRERQRKMNQSRSKTYKPMYQSMFYRQIVQSEKNQEQNPAVIKTQKMKQFAEHIKEHFVPSISDKKKQQIYQIIQKEKRKEDQRLQRQKQLLQKSKIKGLQYLQSVKKIPKKKKDATKVQPPKTERIKYHNYLTHHSQNTSIKQPWTKILNSSQDKQSKALKIQFQSQKKQIQLKRKQQQTRLLKQGDSSKIDDEYFSMIRAKLDFLKQ